MPVNTDNKFQFNQLMLAQFFRVWAKTLTPVAEQILKYRRQ